MQPSLLLQSELENSFSIADNLHQDENMDTFHRADRNRLGNVCKQLDFGHPSHDLKNHIIQCIKY